MGTGVDSGRGGSPPPYPGRPPRPAMPPRPAPPAPPLMAPRYAVPPRPRYQPDVPPARARAARSTAAAGLCLLLGAGLLGGAAAGHWLSGDPAAAQTAQDRIAQAWAQDRELWHSVPVDTLFPPTVNGPGAGPGQADRRWIRAGVAPDGDCSGAFDPALARALAPAGCTRLLRATYTDATATSVITVGVLFARSEPAAMTTLSGRFAAQHLGERADMMPRPVAFPGTAAAGFGPAQRASWSVDFPEGLPVVVYAVSGFADGRVVTDPQPAADATAGGATSAPAQAGLGYDAQGLVAAVRFRLTAAARHPRQSASGAAR